MLDPELLERRRFHMAAVIFFLRIWQRQKWILSDVNFKHERQTKADYDDQLDTFSLNWKEQELTD